MAIETQLITEGFIFKLNGEEVCVSKDIDDQLMLCKTDTYEIVGPIPKDFIVKYLKETGQELLVDDTLYKIGEAIIQFLEPKEGSHINPGYKTNLGYKNTQQIGAEMLKIIDKIIYLS